MHIRGSIYASVVTYFLVQFPVSATKVNVESSYFSYLHKHQIREMCVHCMFWRHHHNQPCYAIIHPGVLWVRLHPCLITDSRCRWLKAGALGKKRKRGRRKKRTSTWSLCCSSLGLLSVWLALFLQQSAARNKTYNFIRADHSAPSFAFILHLTALS